MTKTTDTLVRDIYQLMETKDIPKGVDLRAECDAFGQEMADMLYAQLQPEMPRIGRLRLSAMGKPDRQIYNGYHGIDGQDIRGATYIKFMYGHLIESMLLALVKISGHEVTDQQKEVDVGGVKGHIDCRIDGTLVDVKSCSSFGFKKFYKNTLHEDDPFGYIAQIRCYAHAEGDRTYGWLAMDKQNGTLAWLQYDEDGGDGRPYKDAIDWDVAERVEHVKKMVGSDIVPSVCYEPLPDGKSGNEKLQQGCVWCAYRDTCWPDARAYRYSTGVRYLTKVVKEPRVLEIPDEF